MQAGKRIFTSNSTNSKRKCKDISGWYRQGVDINQEVMQVSEDIAEGKSSLDVDYGMTKENKAKVEERYGTGKYVSEVDYKAQDRDSAYMDAVNRGDMETAQRMVDEAAKEAGYNSQKLYHGTKMFGFTEVKTSGVEKGVDWSPFFAANEEDIAASYVPYGKVRGIASSMDDYTIEEARERAIEEIQENIIDLVYEFRGLIDRYFSPWVFGQTDNSYLEKLVEEANPILLSVMLYLLVLTDFSSLGQIILFLMQKQNWTSI